MACSKYTLTNTGTTAVNFNYRRCDDAMWQYQVNLDPNETKNIWLINGTYSIASLFQPNILLVNNGVYPLTPTPTPTNTPTPTITPTASVTPTITPTASVTPTTTITPTASVTPTITPTPTNTQTPTNTPTTSVTPTPTITPTASVTPTPTITPTASVTPTITPTNTQTPTNTPTPTITPTNALDSFSITSGSTANAACAGGLSGTIYAENLLFDTNTQFYNNPNSTVSGNMSGFYSFGGQVVQLNSNGSLTTGIYTLCSAVPSPTPTPTQTQTPTITPTNTSTPTPTPTNTVTPTNTQTPTNTSTPTPTPTIGYYTYSLGTGATSTDACNDFVSAPNTIYGTVSGGPGPNPGEFLYFNTGLTIPVANGYYSNGVGWYEVTGGAGEITSAAPAGC
jgi:hypothetical protein